MSEFIVTYTPIFRKNVLKELKAIDSAAEFKLLIDDSTALISTSLKRDEFIEACMKKSPIFVKHMMPVDKVADLKFSKEYDSEVLVSLANQIANLNKGDKYAVQCRIKNSRSKGIDYTAKDVEVAVGMDLEKTGGIPTFSDRNLKNEDINVVSILVNDGTAYMGFSTSEQNLNFHCDEYRICGRDGREISRAENKLKEALAKFNIKLSGVGYALDIGAAPGGWTKVLADYGYNVVAVDPGDLKAELYDNPKIRHYKCRIEELDFKNCFDIIVNDMNVDPDITAQIMNSLSPTLKENGLAVVTFKLPNIGMESIEVASEIISDKYDVLNIKSLFHNRQEVTVLLRKKMQAK